MLAYFEPHLDTTSLVNIKTFYKRLFPCFSLLRALMETEARCSEVTRFNGTLQATVEL